MSIKLRQKKLAKGAFRYYLDIYIDGKRNYESLDIRVEPTDSRELKKEKKTIANLIRSNRELEFLTSNTSYIPKHLKKTTFQSFADDYIDRYSKKDLRMIKAAVNHFKLYCKNPNIQMREIDPSLMKGFMDYLNDDANLSGESPHNYYTRFKKILKDAQARGLIIENPTKDIKFRKKTQTNELRKQVLSTDELKELAKTECGNGELKKAFIFSCFTGLGYAEIKKLKWKNIKNGRVITRREKTNRKVNVKIKESILNMLGNPKSNENFVFSIKNDSGKLISDNGVNKCLKNWVKQAKIDKHITFYCARHTFATQLLLHGANLKTVADSLGHSSTKQTLKYLNYIDSLADDAVDNLPELDL